MHPDDHARAYSIVSHPRVWGMLRIDGIEEPTYDFDKDNLFVFKEDQGFVMFRKITPDMWEIHIAMKKGSKDLASYCRQLIKNIKDIGVKKILAPIGEWNKAALRLAKACGFQEEGRITRAYSRDGVSFSMIMMGL